MNDRFTMLGRLASGVAHDLANYLVVVDLSLASIRRRVGDTATGDVATAREATEHAIRLTGCLLEYARGGSPPPRPVDMVALVRRLLDLFGRVIPEHVQLDFDCDADPPLIDGVAAELEQLVLNLVLNACDAMPEGGRLRLTVREVEDAVRLEVSDTGSGLATGCRPLGPGPTPSSKAGRAGGSGLGLSIVREVADRHEASLQIAPGPGAGTRVQVSFPVRKTPAVCNGC